MEAAEALGNRYILNTPISSYKSGQVIRISSLYFGFISYIFALLFTLHAPPSEGVVENKSNET